MENPLTATIFYASQTVPEFKKYQKYSAIDLLGKHRKIILILIDDLIADFRLFRSKSWRYRVFNSRNYFYIRV